MVRNAGRQAERSTSRRRDQKAYRQKRRIYEVTQKRRQGQRPDSPCSVNAENTGRQAGRREGKTYIRQKNGKEATGICICI
jgi:hypothetical protein